MSTENELELVKIMIDHLKEDIKYHQKMIKKHEKAIMKKRQKINDLKMIEESERSNQFSSGRDYDESKIDEEIDLISNSNPIDLIEIFEEKNLLSFHEMNLREGLMKALKDNGFDKPFEIQQKSIMPLIEGCDAIIKSKWQSGRTVAASVATIERIDPKINECQAIFITPRKEFALHIEAIFMKLSSYLNIKCDSCVGINNITDDTTAILLGAHIIVGTPSRIYDMINRKVLGIKFIKLIIFDEINELMETCFKYILQIIQFFNSKIQFVFITTSINETILDLSQKIMKNPLRICENKRLLLNNIKQYYIQLETNDYKFDTLIDLFEILTKTPVIVFCNTKQEVKQLKQMMENKSLAVSSTHIEMDTKDIYASVEELNSGNSPVLITTDYFARIINLNDIELIINYDFPIRPKSYAKRIGNCTDIERNLIIINFVLDNEMKLMADIENYFDCIVEKMPTNIELI